MPDADFLVNEFLCSGFYATLLFMSKLKNMKTITLFRKNITLVAVLSYIVFNFSEVNAQVIRSYTNVYSDNIRGGHTIIGNTFSAIYSSGSGSSGTVDLAKMNDFSTTGYSNSQTSAYGNDNSNIQLVDIDGNTQTASSSSANLTLPAGVNTVKFARLFWGGRITGGMGGANNINLRTIKFKFNTEGYVTAVATSAAIDKAFISGSGIDSTYQAYYDVTAYVNARKSGTYTLADIAAEKGAHSGGGNFAGWAMVVVYENLSLPFSSIRIYDGYLQVYDNGSVISQTITLSGLNPPANFSLSSDAYMSTMSWEGDANLAASTNNPNGDYEKVNGIAVYNAVNPVSNFWNGTISRNGTHLTGTKNPDFLNQMGIDIDEVEVGTGYGISPATTSINIEFGTEADQYFPSVFAFTMKTKPPLVRLDKFVKDTASGNAAWQVPNDTLNPNEILTYTITGKNMGSGNALNCVIMDTLPGPLTYRIGSLKVNAPTPGIVPGFKTEGEGDDAAFIKYIGGRVYVKFFIGTGATAGSGGMLAPNDSFNVQFQCIVPPNAMALNYVTNTARITGTEQDGVTPFVDDGTAIIGPPIIPLSVKLTDFTVQFRDKNALLNWSTGFESENHHFEIERSLDGSNFITTGTVRGNGSTTQLSNYSFADPVITSAKIIYYRLKIVSDDNKGYYSKIIALRLNGLVTLENFSVYPNPFTNNLKLMINSNMETILAIQIRSVSGQKESSYRVAVQSGENVVVLSGLETLRSGIHLLEIITHDGRMTQRIFKQ